MIQLLWFMQMIYIWIFWRNRISTAMKKMAQLNWLYPSEAVSYQDNSVMFEHSIAISLSPRIGCSKNIDNVSFWLWLMSVPWVLQYYWCWPLALAASPIIPQTGSPCSFTACDSQGQTLTLSIGDLVAEWPHTLTHIPNGPRGTGKNGLQRN